MSSRRGSNPHDLSATGLSTLRVYRFHHPRLYSRWGEIRTLSDGFWRPVSLPVGIPIYEDPTRIRTWLTGVATRYHPETDGIDLAAQLGFEPRSFRLTAGRLASYTTAQCVPPPRVEREPPGFQASAHTSTLWRVMSVDWVGFEPTGPPKGLRGYSPPLSTAQPPIRKRLATKAIAMVRIQTHASPQARKSR